MSRSKKDALHYGLATHAGPIKQVNEDRVFIRIGEDSNDHPCIMAIMADGMGGLQSGDLASEMALDVLKQWWTERLDFIIHKKDFFEIVEKEIREKFKEINQSLLHLEKEKGLKTGTTLSVFFMYKGQYLVQHVGDSRVYQIVQEENSVTTKQNNKVNYRLTQLTEDHSWVGIQMKHGRLSAEEARIHPRRNVLLQCIGVNNELTTFSQEDNYQAEDLFLLCSDGFHSMFSEQEIIELIASLEFKGYSLEAISNYLVEGAIEAGATDNISVALIRQGTRIETRWRKVIGVLKSFQRR